MPGGTVLRITRLCRPDAGGASRTAAAISSTARRMKDRSVPPRGVDGVPTQTSDRSAPASASAADVVACSVPPATTAGDEVVEAGLGDRAAAGLDLTDLGLVDVDAPDVVAVGGQAGGGDRADIAQADYCNLHVEVTSSWACKELRAYEIRSGRSDTGNAPA